MNGIWVQGIGDMWVGVLRGVWLAKGARSMYVSRSVGYACMKGMGECDDMSDEW